MAADKVEPSVLYAGVSPDEVRLEDLGVITACFHRASGQTHLLMEPSPEIMAHLWGRTLSISDLSDALAGEFEVTADEGAAFADTLTARLSELAAIGLVTISETPADA